MPFLNPNIFLQSSQVYDQTLLIPSLFHYSPHVTNNALAAMTIFSTINTFEIYVTIILCFRLKIIYKVISGSMIIIFQKRISCPQQQ